LADKNDKKFVKAAANADTQKAQNGTGSLSENSSVSEVIVLQLLSQIPDFAADTFTFNGPLSVTTQVSRFQKGKTNLDFAEARHSEWQWHQLGHMQVYTLLQTANHASTSPLKFFTGWMPFLLPNQQRQSTEGTCCRHLKDIQCSVFDVIINADCTSASMDRVFGCICRCLYKLTEQLPKKQSFV